MVQGSACDRALVWVSNLDFGFGCGVNSQDVVFTAFGVLGLRPNVPGETEN